MSNWKIYDPDAKAAMRKIDLPKPPPWRQAGPARRSVIASTFRATPEVVTAVNVALHLRRPLLITGQPGTGKSSLIYAVAQQLKLGEVLVWPINSRSTLGAGLYRYDALARLQAIQERQASGHEGGAAPRIRSKPAPLPSEDQDLGSFITLGPLGSALAAADAPRALLIDEIDKSDIDLPNDLLNVLDTGSFDIPELQRLARTQAKVTVSSDTGPVVVREGKVSFSDYPFIVMTSNGERDFPAPFLRRCVQCELKQPGEDQLKNILRAHMPHLIDEDPTVRTMLSDFVARRDQGALATDQLLNAQHLAKLWTALGDTEQNLVLDVLFKRLDG